MPVSEQHLSAVYSELHDLASHYLRAERESPTLSATVVVHEAYLRLAASGRNWESRGHYFKVAASTMRRVLVDRARRLKAQKRGDRPQRISLSEAVQEFEGGRADVLDLDAKLEELERIQERHARVVELRFFAGLSIEETAQTLGVSAMTVKNDWRMARAWLAKELQA